MGKKDKTVEFLLEGEENLSETLASRDVAALLDELGALMQAEKMTLAFDDDDTLIGICIGTKVFVDNASEGVEDLFDLVTVEPGGEIIN